MKLDFAVSAGWEGTARDLQWHARCARQTFDSVC